MKTIVEDVIDPKCLSARLCDWKIYNHSLHQEGGREGGLPGEVREDQDTAPPSQHLAREDMGTFTP